YGGGATGGVVNIILRRDYSGIDLRATYANTFDSDTSGYKIEGSGGFSLEDGRTHVMVAASHDESNPLLTGDRDFVARARALQLANNPGAFFNTSTPPLGFLPNIRSVNGSNLVLDTGPALGSPFTFVPQGYAGVSTDNGAALAANAGRYSLELPQ